MKRLISTIATGVTLLTIGLSAASANNQPPNPTTRPINNPGTVVQNLLKPDLVITNIMNTTSPINNADGTVDYVLSSEITVKNQGTSKAGTFHLNAVTQDGSMPSFTDQPLEAGASKTIVIMQVVDDIGNGRIVTVTIDTQNAVSESNESNNSATKPY